MLGPIDGNQRVRVIKPISHFGKIYKSSDGIILHTKLFYVALKQMKN
jgi:hypothetical protein